MSHNRRRVVCVAFLLACLAAVPVAAAGVTVDPCACASDVDGDGTTGFADLLSVLGAWGPCAACPEDLDGDGAVAFADLLGVLQGWGPCTFAYGPPRGNAEAEQIGLETTPGLNLPDALYERVERDLGLIRAFEPDLADQAHTPAWAPDRLIVRKAEGTSADAYDALNACFQLVSEDNFAFDFWLLVFPAHVNVEALASHYEALDHVLSAEPDVLLGGENFYRVSFLLDGSWRWDIDDGWWDCFDGCDCHRVYVFDVDPKGNVELVSFDEFGFPWCLDQ